MNVTELFVKVDNIVWSAKKNTKIARDPRKNVSTKSSDGEPPSMYQIKDILIELITMTGIAITEKLPIKNLMKLLSLQTGEMTKFSTFSDRWGLKYQNLKDKINMREYTL